MPDTERLPRVEEQFNVLAPEGGFRRQLRSYDVQARTTFDVEIEGMYRNKMWLRIIPVRDEVVLKTDHPQVYQINKGFAYFITHEGGTRLQDRPKMEIWAEIDTSVTVGGMPAGRLKLWADPLIIDQVGA